MNKELYVSSTPHETKVALLEDDQLAEIYYERANEYTLAGSIYKGRVTRVLPGMQSAFVDIGLERDAFLYVSDFLDLQEEDDDDDFGDVKVTGPSLAKANGFVVEKQGSAEVEEEDDDTEEGEELSEGAMSEQHAGDSAAAPKDKDDDGSRRWRGRRRRRGRRGGRDRFTPQNPEGASGEATEQSAAPDNEHQEFVEEEDLGEDQVEHVAHASGSGNEVELEGMHGYVDEGRHESYAPSSGEPTLLPGETRAPRAPRAPGEATEEPSAPKEYGRSEGFRGGRDRDRGGRGGRDRGGRDRGGRDRGGRDRGDREPRSREPEAPLPTNYTPMLLPGESLSKYRGHR